MLLPGFNARPELGNKSPAVSRTGVLFDIDPLPYGPLFFED
jgi:hypothetical protein